MRTNNPETTQAAFMGIYSVMRLTDLSKASIYRLMKAGRFPASHQLTPSGRRVAWRENEVLAWVAAPFDWNQPITF